MDNQSTQFYNACAAIRRDDIKNLQMIYRNHHSELANQDSFVTNLFTFAITFEAIHCAKFLFNNGEFDFNKQEESNVFKRLVEERKFDFIKQLLDSAPEGVIKNSSAIYELLKMAIAQRDIVLSHYLLVEKNINLPLTSATEDSLLFYSVKMNDFNTAKYLITSGKYNVNSTSFTEETLLMTFASNNHLSFGAIEFIRFLLEQDGLDLEAQCKSFHNVTALHIAGMYNNTLLFNLLLDHRAKIDALSDEGLTPISHILNQIFKNSNDALESADQIQPYHLAEKPLAQELLTKLIKNNIDLSNIKFTEKQTSNLLITLLDSHLSLDEIQVIFSNESITSKSFYNVLRTLSDKTYDIQTNKYLWSGPVGLYIHRTIELYNKFLSFSSNASLETFSLDEVKNFHSYIKHHESLVIDEDTKFIPNIHVLIALRMQSFLDPDKNTKDIILDNLLSAAKKYSSSGDSENALLVARNYLQLVYKYNISSFDDYQNALEIIKLIEESSTEAVDLSLEEAEKIIINIVKGVTSLGMPDLISIKSIQTYCQEIEDLGNLASKEKLSKLHLTAKKHYINVIKIISSEDRASILTEIINKIETIERSQQLMEIFLETKQKIYDSSLKYNNSKNPAKKEQLKTCLIELANNLKNIYNELLSLNNHAPCVKDIDKIHEIKGIGFIKQYLPPKSKNSSKLSSIAEDNPFTSGSYTVDKSSVGEDNGDDSASVFSGYTNFTFLTLGSSILGTRSVFSEYTPFPDQIRPASGSAEGGPGLAAGNAGGAPVISWPSENNKLKWALDKLHGINKGKFSTSNMNVLLSNLPAILIKVATTDGFLIKSLVTNEITSTHRPHNKDHQGHYDPGLIRELHELVKNSGIYSHYGIDSDEEATDYEAGSVEHDSFDSELANDLDLIGKTDE